MYAYGKEGEKIKNVIIVQKKHFLYFLFIYYISYFILFDYNQPYIY